MAFAEGVTPKDIASMSNLSSVMLKDLEKVRAGGEEIGDYVEAYLKVAIDSGKLEPPTRAAMLKAAKSLSDEVEGRCPAAIMAAMPPIMAYGPDIEEGAVLFCTSTSTGKSLYCTVLADQLPGDDWPMLKEVREAKYHPGAIWGTMLDVIEDNGENEAKHYGMVNSVLLRIGISERGTLDSLKSSCQTLIKAGLTPLIATIAHRKPQGVAALTLTIMLPPPVRKQVEYAEQMSQPMKGMH